VILEAFQHARNSFNLFHASDAWFVSFYVHIVLNPVYRVMLYYFIVIHEE